MPLTLKKHSSHSYSLTLSLSHPTPKLHLLLIYTPSLPLSSPSSPTCNRHLLLTRRPLLPLTADCRLLPVTAACSLPPLTYCHLSRCHLLPAAATCSLLLFIKNKSCDFVSCLCQMIFEFCGFFIPCGSRYFEENKYMILFVCFYIICS